MLRRLSLLALAAVLPSPLAAQQITKKFDYAPVNGVQEIRMELDQVVINQITFKPGKALGGPIRRSDASAEVRVDNNGRKKQVVGVAVVVLDGEGNIVAAGSGGTRVGSLEAGERDISRIAFPFVFRYIDGAKAFMMTLELAEAKAAATPTP